MTRLAMVTAQLEALKRAKLKADIHRWETKQISRLEEKRRININTREADAIREALNDSPPGAA